MILVYIIGVAMAILGFGMMVKAEDVSQFFGGLIILLAAIVTVYWIAFSGGRPLGGG